MLNTAEYLGGIVDLTGEIGRYAVASATERNLAQVRECFETTSVINNQLSLMTMQGGLRKKVSVSFDVRVVGDQWIDMDGACGLQHFLTLQHKRLRAAYRPTPDACALLRHRPPQTGALGTNLKKMKGVLYELALAEAGRTSRAPPAGANEEAAPSGGMDEDA